MAFSTKIFRQPHNSDGLHYDFGSVQKRFPTVRCSVGGSSALTNFRAEPGGSVMGKGSRLGDRPEHGDGTRIIRSRIGARAAASPIAETITGRRRCADRESRATSMPTAPGTYMAACPSTYRQVILGAEFRRVGRLHRWGDAM